VSKQRSALICGAGGFIGRQCASAFQQAGWRVFGAGRSRHPQQDHAFPYFPGDLGERDYVARTMSESQPDRVIFAAGPSSVRGSFADPCSDFAQQTLPMMRVLDGARGLPKRPGVLLVSSAAVYGNPACTPVCESDAAAPISPYGFHKLQQELLLKEYASLYGVPTCSARVFSTYGAGLRHLAVWDIAQRALKGDFTLQGTGAESRDYLHVSDVALAMERICRDAPFEGECINVASGREIDIEQLASLIYRTLALSERPSFTGSGEPGKPLRWRANVDRLHALGFSPRTALEQGLRDTLQWIRTDA
jgi:UDP-glucose 4-epimerase